jgi:hypothetical protein
MANSIVRAAGAARKSTSCTRRREYTALAHNHDFILHAGLNGTVGGGAHAIEVYMRAVDASPLLYDGVPIHWKLGGYSTRKSLPSLCLISRSQVDRYALEEQKLTGLSVRVTKASPSYNL